ncbi:MAG: UDP-N-acetylmuramate dehydrogenase [Erysipelotrichaceae bacterium]
MNKFDREQLLLLGDFEVEVNLKNYSTMRVGGGCLGVFFPDSITNLVDGLKYLRSYEIPYKVLGKGSNVLCSDDYYHGVIIKLDRYLNTYHREGNIVRVDAGCSIIKLAQECSVMSLSGLQYAGGIPGTIGGAIFMNAGAYNHNTAEITHRVLIIDENLELKWLRYEDCDFSYRHSIFQTKNWLIVQAELIFEILPAHSINKIMDNRKKRRVENQPLGVPSAGSCFKNPQEKHAWQYIDEAGLRGYRVGGASVSNKHCNFIVNDQKGSADDVMAVINHVQSEVKKHSGIELERELELFNWHEK